MNKLLFLIAFTAAMIAQAAIEADNMPVLITNFIILASATATLYIKNLKRP